MRLAILFWIYKEPGVCVNRARWLRQMNPGASIYCLYGGLASDAEIFERCLGGLVDDFFAFPENWDDQRKWLNGDQMIGIWFRDRGASLAWDTIFIAQWDLVMLDAVRTVCGSLQEGELLLPGLRPIAEVEHFWWYVRPGSPELHQYRSFERALTFEGNFPDEPLCCNFLAAALPRKFLERYMQVASANGFLEYKIPVFAQIWGFEFCRDHMLNPTWVHERKIPWIRRQFLTLHAEKEPVRTWLLLAHKALPWGRKVFHPYVKSLPLPAIPSRHAAGAREAV